MNKQLDDRTKILYFTIVGYFTFPVARNLMKEFAVAVAIATQGPHFEAWPPSGAVAVTIAKQSHPNFPSLHRSRSIFSFSPKVVVAVARYRATKNQWLIPSHKILCAKNYSIAVAIAKQTANFLLEIYPRQSPSLE